MENVCILKFRNLKCESQSDSISQSVHLSEPVIYTGKWLPDDLSDIRHCGNLLQKSLSRLRWSLKIPFVDPIPDIVVLSRDFTREINLRLETRYRVQALLFHRVFLVLLLRQSRWKALSKFRFQITNSPIVRVFQRKPSTLLCGKGIRWLFDSIPNWFHHLFKLERWPIAHFKLTCLHPVDRMTRRVRRHSFSFRLSFFYRLTWFLSSGMTSNPVFGAIMHFDRHVYRTRSSVKAVAIRNYHIF